MNMVDLKIKSEVGNSIFVELTVQLKRDEVSVE